MGKESFLMEIKSYVRKDSSDQLYIWKGNHVPPDFISEAPIDPLTGKPEEAQWLQIENLEVEPGNFQLVATVNEKLKTKILTERQEEELEKDLAKELKKNSIKALKTKMKNLKKTKFNNAEAVKDAIIDLKDFILAIEEELLGKE